MNCLYLLEENPMIKLAKLTHQTEVISPSNKNISNQNNNISKDTLQIRTSPAQNIELQTQSSPQNGIQINHLNQQSQNLNQRRSPSHNQYINQNPNNSQAYFHSQSPSSGYPPNYVPIENQNQSYPEEFNQQLGQQQRMHYQQEMMNQFKPHIHNNYNPQHQNPNLLQQKIQNNFSGIEEDYRLMSESMVKAPYPPIDYQRQNVMEETRSLFLDPNNNSLNQMYSPYQIVDNFMSFSGRKSNSNHPKNNQGYNSQIQNEFEKYVHPYDHQQSQQIGRQSLIQQQQLKQSQEQIGQNSWQDSRRQFSNSNQQQNTADFQSDNRSKLDLNEQNYRIASNSKSLKNSGQISPQPNTNTERQLWMQLEMKYIEEIGLLQKDLVNAKYQISSLGNIVEKMQEVKNQLIEKIALIAESLSLFKEEVYQRLDLVEKDVAFVNTNQNTFQGDKILKEDDLIQSANNDDRTPPKKLEPQKSTSQPSLNTKQDILEKYLPRKNSSNHQFATYPSQEPSDQQKSLSTVVNNVLDKKLQDLEANLSRTLMKSLHQIQQTQTAVEDRLSQVKDSHKEISPILLQSRQSSSNYPRINSPQKKQNQSISVREAQLNGFYSHGNSNENLQNLLSSKGLNHLKKSRENDYFGSQSVVHNARNMANIQSFALLSQNKSQDQKNSRVIQLLDKLQSKLAQRQNKVEELNEKEKRLKQKKDNLGKENKERSKQKKTKEQKHSKQLYSEESFD